MIITRRCYSLPNMIARKFSKLSYFHNPGTEPLRALTVGQLLDITSEKWPDRKAIISVHEKKEITFEEAKKQAEQLGAGFLKLGLRPGDRIATFGGNTVHWYMTAMAAAKAGLILTGLNPNYEKDELLFTLKKVGVKAIVADTKYKTTDYYRLLSEVIPELPGTTNSSPIISQNLPDLKFVIFASSEDLPGSYKYEDVSNCATSCDELLKIQRGLDPDRAFNIQFTSGTTGTPKAAVVSHFGAVNNAHFFGKKCGFHKQPSVICVQVPFFHVFGTVLGIVLATDLATTLVLPDIAFNKQSTVRALSKHRCTAIYGTPTMYVDACTAVKDELNRNEEFKDCLQNFNVVVSGGSLCPPQLFHEISQTFNCNNLQSAYGMSEMGPITFTNTSQDTYEQRTTTVGRVAEHQEVKVVDTEGNMVPFGTPGEVWFRGYALMLGYWDDEERTKEIMTPTGWLKSGDQMVLTEQGYGTITGRLKDQINRGGEKIMPSEIEQVLEKHPDVQEVHVIGVSDYRMGEEICACIRTTKRTTEDDIKSFCKGKLSRFKIPKHIKFMDSFPTTGSGKVKKFVLKQIMEDQLSKP